MGGERRYRLRHRGYLGRRYVAQGRERRRQPRREWHPTRAEFPRGGGDEGEVGVYPPLHFFLLFLPFFVFCFLLFFCFVAFWLFGFVSFFIYFLAFLLLAFLFSAFCFAVYFFCFFAFLPFVLFCCFASSSVLSHHRCPSSLDFLHSLMWIIFLLPPSPNLRPSSFTPQRQVCGRFFVFLSRLWWDTKGLQAGNKRS